MSFAGRKQCECERFSQLDPDVPVRQWVVLQRKQNSSNKNGRDWSLWSRMKTETSDWSHVFCITCGAHWRTSAGYVDQLPDAIAAIRELVAGRLRQGDKADARILELLKPMARTQAQARKRNLARLGSRKRARSKPRTRAAAPRRIRRKK